MLHEGACNTNLLPMLFYRTASALTKINVVRPKEYAQINDIHIHRANRR